MAADNTTLGPLDRRLGVPQPGRRGVPSSAADRLVLQIESVDGWLAARRAREQALQAAPGLSRDERMDAAREVEALQRTHDMIKDRCARGSNAEIGLLRAPGPTAVIAHRHAWFADKLARQLADREIAVLVSTDNGAEALGAIVAEQPDIVLTGDRLAMISGQVLLEQTRVYAPGTLVAAHVSDPDHADVLQAVADAVFLRQHPPAVVADALLALHQTPNGGLERV